LNYLSPQADVIATALDGNLVGLMMSLFLTAPPLTLSLKIMPAADVGANPWESHYFLFFGVCNGFGPRESEFYTNALP
jgi:hypothetical protein